MTNFVVVWVDRAVKSYVVHCFSGKLIGTVTKSYTENIVEQFWIPLQTSTKYCEGFPVRQPFILLTILKADLLAKWPNNLQSLEH